MNKQQAGWKIDQKWICSFIRSESNLVTPMSHSEFFFCEDYLLENVVNPMFCCLFVSKSPNLEKTTTTQGLGQYPQPQKAFFALDKVRN